MRAPVQTGNLVLDLDSRIAEVDNQRLRLAGKEYAVLELLSFHKGRTVTKEMLLEHLYGQIDTAKVKTLRVLVRNVRKKIAHAVDGEDLIETVARRGYRLRDIVE